MELVLLSADPVSGSVVPALSMLAHSMRSAAPEVVALLGARPYDAVLVDARTDLAGSRGLCQLLRSTGLDVPVVVVISEGALVVLSADCGCDEILLPPAGPAEVDARLRLLVARRATESVVGGGSSRVFGEPVIDEATYTARVRGRPLEFSQKEFELLKYLAQHAGRVFTRAQLLHKVSGYNFFGATRTLTSMCGGCAPKCSSTAATPSTKAAFAVRSNGWVHLTQPAAQTFYNTMHVGEEVQVVS